MHLAKNVGMIALAVVLTLALGACGDDGSSSGSGSGAAADPISVWYGDGSTQSPTEWDSTGGQDFPGMYNDTSNGSTNTGVPTSGTAFYDSTGHPLLCPAWCPTNSASTNSMEASLRTLINAYRISNNLPALLVDPELDDVARGEVKHEVIHNYSGLTNPEGDTVTERLSALSITSTNSFEAQHVGTGETAQDIFNALIADPSTSSAILDPAADGLGVGHTDMGTSDRTSIVINHTD